MDRRTASCLTALLVSVAVVIGLVVLLCAVGFFFVLRSFRATEDPAEVRRLTRQVTAAALPETFEPVGAVDFGMFGTGATVVAYTDPRVKVAEPGLAAAETVPPEPPSPGLQSLERRSVVLLIALARAPRRGRINVRGVGDTSVQEMVQRGYQVDERRFYGKLNGAPAAAVVRYYHRTTGHEPQESVEPATPSGGSPAGKRPATPESDSSEHAPKEAPLKRAKADSAPQKTTSDQPPSEGAAAKDVEAAEADVLEQIPEKPADLLEIIVVVTTSNRALTVLMRGPPDWVDRELIRQIVAQSK